MALKKYTGRTEDAENPFLSAEFWKEGTRITGIVEREFKAGEQVCYELKLAESVTLSDEETDVVNIGTMAGLRMALQAARVKKLIVGDKVSIECTGFTKAKKTGNSDRVNFSIELYRDPQQAQSEEYF